MKIIPDTSLFVILARKAPVGVIFRRGPSKQVQLIQWDREKDTFEEGQWLKGRVYERRCDLSPNGTLLIYFAATYKGPMRSWTAISKPRGLPPSRSGRRAMVGMVAVFLTGRMRSG